MLDKGLEVDIFLSSGPDAIAGTGDECFLLEVLDGSPWTPVVKEISEVGLAMPDFDHFGKRRHRAVAQNSTGGGGGQTAGFGPCFHFPGHFGYRFF